MLGSVREIRKPFLKRKRYRIEAVNKKMVMTNKRLLR